MSTASGNPTPTRDHHERNEKPTMTSMDTWKAQFAAINTKADAMWDEHQERMAHLAAELERLRIEFADNWLDGIDDDELRQQAYIDAGYISADQAVGYDHEGNAY